MGGGAIAGMAWFVRRGSTAGGGGVTTAIGPDGRLMLFCWANPAEAGAGAAGRPGTFTAGGNGGGWKAMRGGCEAPGRGGGPKPGADPGGRAALLGAGGGVEPGLPGTTPGRDGGSGSFGAAVDDAALAPAAGVIAADALDSAAAAISSGGGARPASVCACILLEGELTLLVPSASPSSDTSVAAPTFRNSSDRAGVPTAITRVITEPSPPDGFGADGAGSTRSAGGAVKSPETVAPSASTSSAELPTDTVEFMFEPDAPLCALAGDGFALPGALGLVVEESAIKRASSVERT